MESVSRPGGNITGVRLYTQDLLLKRLEILLEIVSETKRIWLPYNPEIATAVIAIDDLRRTAAGAGATLIEARISNMQALKASLKRLDAIMLMPDAILEILT